MRGVKVGDLDSSDTVIEAVLPPLANLLSMNRRGSSSARVWKAMKEGASGERRLMSRATMLMAPRVQSRVVEGAAGEWRECPWG
jgi:hypothetical protein